MSRNRKNKNVFLTLYDREYNAKTAYFSSVNVISTLLRSDRPLYKTFWHRSSNLPIKYDEGYLYFLNYVSGCYTINGRGGRPMKLFEFEDRKSRREIYAAALYSTPIYKNSDNICQCPRKICTCFTQYLLLVTQDKWLCQYSKTTGKLLREIYVKRNGSDFVYRHCNWDTYGDRFVLNSTIYPDPLRYTDDYDIFVNLVVFTSSPFDFLMLTEIKRSVFGQGCELAKISDRFLLIGLGYSTVNMYSFDDFINQGNLIPYKLGQIYADRGTIGSYPTGLPLNFTYSEAPPLLYKVQGFGHIIRFGGYPYHYITSAPKSYDWFAVKCVKTNLPSQEKRIMAEFHNDETDALVFHPDQSNRLLFKCYGAIHSLGLSYRDGHSKLDKLFSMGLNKSADTTLSLFGPNKKFTCMKNYCVCSIDYARDLDLFAVMSMNIGKSNSLAFVQLYDNSTGEEIRTVELPGRVNGCSTYQLYIAMDSIIIIEKKGRFNYSVRVLNM